MKQKISYLWEAFYPIIIYAFLVTAVHTLLTDYSPVQITSPMLRQAVGQVVCMIPMYYFYSKIGQGKRKLGNLSLDIIIVVVAGITLSVGFNQLIDLSPIKGHSPGFWRISQRIYSDKHLYQLIAVGICAPILEELIFRGIVFGNLKKVVGSFVAILLSALVFGSMHGNLVQFLYAALLGVAFAYIYDKTDTLWLCMLAHAAANIFSLLSTWYGINKVLTQTETISLTVGVAGVLIGTVILARWKRA
ncbi:MAG: CPBP family intramembrane metalloprotease [Lachnospiraceae bacterium]|jgi:hypothetical protein|nr:CPBP family intramembrane metalloprotease [Lachnospiraceae bacterium]